MSGLSLALEDLARVEAALLTVRAAVTVGMSLEAAGDDGLAGVVTVGLEAADRAFSRLADLRSHLRQLS